MERYVNPCRIVLAKDVEHQDELLQDKPVQAGFSNDHCALIRQGGYVVLGFEKERSGGVVIVTQGRPDIKAYRKCRVVFGESVMESLSSIGYKNATNDHSIRDTVLELPAMGTLRYGNTGFRFVKLEAVEGDILIRTVKACLDIKDIRYQGSFTCSDPLLNKIWDVGAYTVFLNMHEYLLEGLKRDRLVWQGDMHPEVSTIRVVFGMDDCVPNSLDLGKAEFPPGQWLNFFPAYSMWRIAIHYDWYMQNGDFEYLKAQEDYIKKMVENVILWVKKEEKDPEELFIDWSSRGNLEQTMTGIYASIFNGIKNAKKIFAILNNQEMEDVCDDFLQEMPSAHILVYVIANILIKRFFQKVHWRGCLHSLVTMCLKRAAWLEM